MRCAKMHGLLRAIAAMLALLLLAALQAGLCESAEAAPPHNYILVIDNSRSTTGRHSLGEATDPEGLRFDAARLVYQNVLSSGRGGQMGVIVFCGTKNCVTYGPVDIQSPEMDSVIGGNLSEDANRRRRDDYTDIRTALETARSMMADFEGKTSVILLTDGVNDLTNRSDPFTRPENIEANEKSVEAAQAIREAGADFHVIALTTRENVSADDPFMAFINRLAEAGGGTEDENARYDNVLVATQEDLNSALLQMLIKAESASDTIQTIVEYTPVYKPFVVPYEGITDATVNITFMPEDKPSLEKVELVAPYGEIYTLWEQGQAREQGGITVMEDRSYIMLAIPSPQPGNWNVAVTSRKEDSGDDSRVLINAIVRFNHNLRLMVDVPEQLYVDDPMSVAVWFQVFNGEAFEDLTESDIYDQSTARIIIITPGDKKWSGGMKLKGQRYEVSIAPKLAGEWRAQVRVRNPYVQETSDELTFTVSERPTLAPNTTATPAPTQRPTAEPVAASAQTPGPDPVDTPTPVPTVKPIEGMKLRIKPVVMKGGENFIHSDGRNITVSWKADKDAEWVSAELLEDGVHLMDLESGDRIDPKKLKEDAEYEVRVSVMPQFGGANDAEEYTESLNFRLLPEVAEVNGIQLFVDPLVKDDEGNEYLDRDAEAVVLSWVADGETESETARLLEDGAYLMDVQSGVGIDRAVFRDGAEYTLEVSVMPKNGAALGAKSVTAAATFRLYPAAEPVVGLALEVSDGSLKDGIYRLKGNSATLSWHIDGGDVDHYELSIMGEADAVRETLTGTSYTFSTDVKGDYVAALTAVPRYARGGDGNITATVVIRPHIATFVEKYWPFGVGILALLAIALAVLLILRAARAERIIGKLHVVCEELGLDKQLMFTDGMKGVKPDSPLTAHRDFAKMKGQKAYALLSNIRINTALANNLGRVNCKSDDEALVERVKAVQHRPNERLLALSYEPRRGRKDLCYVGKFDIGESAITVDDGGREYKFLFTGR